MRHVKRSCLSLALLAATCAQAAPPAFRDRRDALPGRHSYTGGWEHFVGGGGAIFDCNGDALPDIFAAGGDAAAQLFINRSSIGGDLAFEAADAPSMTGVTGAYPLDINGDAHPDLVVLRTGPDQILRGEGNCAFSLPEWAPEFGDHWSTAFSATWEPGADWPTLAFGHYVDRNDPDGPFEACDANHLYRFGAKGYGRPHLLKPGYCALSILFSDWRRRGRADLRISNDRHYYVRGGSEQMWFMPEPRPLTAADGWEAISIWGMGIASEDIDGDTRPDVVLTSMGDQLMMIQDAEGRYEMAPYAIGAFAQRPHIGDDGRPSTGWHAEFADVDNDGRSDLFIAKGNVDQMPSNAMRDPNNLLMRRADGTFSEAGAFSWLWTMGRSRGGGLSDFNLDG
ncbi:MAG: VCBS repeat-containing protein, partial [Pseudomonadota bacterium]